MGGPRWWSSLHLPDASLAHPSHSPPCEPLTWEPFVSFAACPSPEAPPSKPPSNAQTRAMRRRIEGDLALYERALRLMFSLPSEGLGDECELGMRLHAMAQAEGLTTGGVDFVEIAADLLDE